MRHIVAAHRMRGIEQSLVQPWKTAGNQIMITMRSRRERAAVFHDENSFQLPTEIIAHKFVEDLISVSSNKGECSAHVFAPLLLASLRDAEECQHFIYPKRIA
ncbi:hypothetical protein SETIT_3G300600v2 [Setaria italica]|uniref:Uncharacterized protein n=2 Tax=Setaria italica TaxID=4555 RepID=A0A368QMD5_SETIT|nr:hypothetical protein SETIT_3G300600v2 [Setaria italica]